MQKQHGIGGALRITEAVQEAFDQREDARDRFESAASSGAMCLESIRSVAWNRIVSAKADPSVYAVMAHPSRCDPRRSGSSLRASGTMPTILLGFALAPVLQACGPAVINTTGGNDPIVPNAQNQTPSAFEFSPIQKTSQDDTGFVKTFGRDNQFEPEQIQTGEGNDAAIALGKTDAGEVTADQLKNFARTSYDLTDLVPIKMVNGLRLPMLQPGDSVDGEQGSDTLFVLGRLAISQIVELDDRNERGIAIKRFEQQEIELRSLEKILVDGTISIEGKKLETLGPDLLQGSLQSILHITGRLNKDLSDEEQKLNISPTRVDLRGLEISGFDRLHIDEGVTLLFNGNRSGGILESVSMITGDGSIVIVQDGTNTNNDVLANTWVENTINLYTRSADSNDPSVALSAFDPDNVDLQGNPIRLDQTDLARSASRAINNTNILDDDDGTMRLGLKYTGTDGIDDFAGTRGDDDLNGGGGADTINGGEGNDFINGGLGEDRLNGSAGQDTFQGTLAELQGDFIRDLMFEDRILLLGPDINYDVVRARIERVGREDGSTFDWFIRVDVNGSGTDDVSITFNPSKSDDVSIFTPVVPIDHPDGVLLVLSKGVDRIDQNDPVTSIQKLSLDPIVVDENAVGSLLAKVFAVDPDQRRIEDSADGTDTFIANPHVSVTWGVDNADPNAPLFTINQQGELRLATGRSLDYETQPQVNATVTASWEDDSGTSQTLSRTFVVNVRDLPEAPSFGRSADSNNIPEKGNSDTSEALAYEYTLAMNPEKGEMLTYSIEGADGDLFRLDTATRKIYFKQPPDYENPLSANGSNVYNFALVVMDSTNLSDRLALTVTVNDINDPPTSFGMTIPDQWVIVQSDVSVTRSGITLSDEDRSIVLPSDLFVDDDDDTIDPVPSTFTFEILDSAGQIVDPTWVMFSREVIDARIGDQQGNYRYALNIPASADIPFASNRQDNTYEVTIMFTDQSGASGDAMFDLIVTNHLLPQILGSSRIEIPTILVENSLQSSLTSEGAEMNTLQNAYELIVVGDDPASPQIVDPEGSTIRLVTRTPLTDADGMTITDSSGNELRTIRYYGEYGYLDIYDSDLSDPDNPVQHYKYTLISRPDQIDEARDQEEREIFLRLSNKTNSLSQGASAQDVIGVRVRDNGLNNDGVQANETQRELAFNIEGINDPPTVRDQVRIEISEPVLRYTDEQMTVVDTTYIDPRSQYQAGPGELLQNVRDIDSGDMLFIGGGFLGQRLIGPLTIVVNDDGSYTVTANQGIGTQVDKLADGEKLVTLIGIPVVDSSQEAAQVSNMLEVTIVGTNDLPEINRTILNESFVDIFSRFTMFSSLFISERANATIDLPEGLIFDRDEADTLSFGYRLLDENFLEVASPWLTIETDTGQLQFSDVPSSAVGSYMLELTGSDAFGSVSTDEISLNVFENTAPSTSGEIDVVTLTADSKNPAGARYESTTADFLKTVVDKTRIGDDNFDVAKDDDPKEKALGLTVEPGVYEGTYGTLRVEGRDGGEQKYSYEVDLTSAATKTIPETGEGNDNFNLKIFDRGGRSVVQMVIFGVMGTNDPPEPSSDAMLTVFEDGQNPYISPVGELFGSITEPDSDPLVVVSFSYTDPERGLVTLEYMGDQESLTVPSMYGVLQVFRNGQVQYNLNNADPRVNALGGGESLLETFVYVVNDRPNSVDVGLTLEQTLQLKVSGNNDAAQLIADIPDQVVAIGQDLSFGVAGYFSDPDDDLIYSLRATGPGIEEGASLNWVRIDSMTGVVTVNPPAERLQGSYELTVRVTDIEGENFVLETFMLDVVTGQPPNVPADVNYPDPLVESNVVNAEDVAIDPALLSVSDTILVVAGTYQGTYGVLTVVGQGNTLQGTYTLDNTDEDTDALGAGAQVTEKVRYLVEDTATGLRTSRFLNISISGTNDNPVSGSIVQQQINLAFQDMIAGDVGVLLTGVSDVDRDTLSVREPAGGFVPLEGLYGTLSVMSDGSYEYIVDPQRTNPLDASELTQDVFNFEVVDNMGGSTPHSLRINVIGRNDPPSFSGGSIPTIVLQSGAPRTFDFVDRGLISDADGDPLRFTLTLSQPDINGNPVVFVAPWLTFSSNTGVLSLTSASVPIVLDARLTVTDGTITPPEQIFKIVLSPDYLPFSQPEGVLTISGKVTEDGSLEQRTLEGDVSDLFSRNADDGSMIYDSASDVSVVGDLVAAMNNAERITVQPGTLQGTYGTLQITDAGSNSRYIYILDDKLLATDALGESNTDPAALDEFSITVTNASGDTTMREIAFNVFGANDAPIIEMFTPDDPALPPLQIDTMSETPITIDDDVTVMDVESDESREYAGVRIDIRRDVLGLNSRDLYSLDLDGTGLSYNDQNMRISIGAFEVVEINSLVGNFGAEVLDVDGFRFVSNNLQLLLMSVQFTFDGRGDRDINLQLTITDSDPLIPRSSSAIKPVQIRQFGFTADRLIDGISNIANVGNRIQVIEFMADFNGRTDDIMYEIVPNVGNVLSFDWQLEGNRLFLPSDAGFEYASRTPSLRVRAYRDLSNDEDVQQTFTLNFNSLTEDLPGLIIPNSAAINPSTVHGEERRYALLDGNNQFGITNYDPGAVMGAPLANNTIYGGSGRDTIYTHVGRDTVYGGSGNDTIALRGTLDANGVPIPDARDIAYGGSGDDEISGGTQNDLLYGGTGADMIDGGADQDEIYGDEGDDTLYGGSGDDVISGGAGRDLLDGDAGDDVLTGDEGADVFQWRQIERRTDVADPIQMDTIGDFMYGDRIDLSMALSMANGNLIDYVTYSVQGNDGVILVDVDADGLDDLELTLTGFSGGLEYGVDADGGVLVLPTSLEFNRITVPTHLPRGDQPIENVNPLDVGLSRNDIRLVLDELSARIDVFGRNITYMIVDVDLEGSNDSGLFELRQDPNELGRYSLLFVDDPGVELLKRSYVVRINAVREQTNIDKTFVVEVQDLDAEDSRLKNYVTYSDGVDDLSMVQEGGATSVDVLLFGGDDIFGMVTDTVAVGGLARNVFGGAGDDVIYGAGGSDRLFGGGGNDTINGGLGPSDVIFGGSGDDTLSGGGGEDTINGESGDDTIIVGLGNDRVSTGSGRDTIRVELNPSVTELNTVSITDFVSGMDTLDISALFDGSSMNFFDYVTVVSDGLIRVDTGGFRRVSDDEASVVTITLPVGLTQLEIGDGLDLQIDANKITDAPAVLNLAAPVHLMTEDKVWSEAVEFDDNFADPEDISSGSGVVGASSLSGDEWGLG